MTAPDLDTLLSWRGRDVRDRNGDKIGKLGALYLDGETERPAYAGLHTGLFGLKESIVPLHGIREEGDALVVPFEGDLVRQAPSVDADEELAPDEQDRLHAHYDGHYEMTRSEEEVTTGTTEMAPAERVRLRKVRVTDHVQQTVPVRREVVQLEHEPPPEGRIERVEDAGEVGGEDERA